MNFIQFKSWRAFLSRVWLSAGWFRKPEPGIVSGRFAADGPCIRHEACACRIDQRGSIRFEQIDAHRIRRSKSKLRKSKRAKPARQKKQVQFNLRLAKIPGGVGDKII